MISILITIFLGFFGGVSIENNTLEFQKMSDIIFSKGAKFNRKHKRVDFNN